MAGTLPYIGSKISLISVSEIRYEGILYTINTQESTVALQTVRSFGTEGRKTPDVPPSNEIYDFIIFRGKDIKDLTVCEPAPPASVSDDPAVLSVNVAPGPGPGGVHHNEPSHHYPSMTQKDHHAYGMNNYHMGGMQQQRSPMATNRMNYNNMGGMPNVSRGYYGGGRGGYNPRPPLGGYDNYRGGYNSMRGRRMMNGSRIVGELAPQPNPGLKSQVATSFNFVENNSKFDKSSLKTDMSTAVANTDGETASVPPLPAVRPGYDKVTSFFDNISCETLDRQSGHETRVDREKQRQLDSDTFGAAAGIVRGSRFRRGGRRSEYGRGGYNSYMGGFSNQNGYDHSFKHPGQVVGGR